MADVLLRHQDEGVLYLTLNRPEVLNAFNEELLEALAQALEDVPLSARAVLVQGSGRAFSAGQDLNEAPRSYRSHLTHYNRGIRALSRLDRPVIAALHGAVAGAGLSLALACDLRIASEDVMLTTGFSRIGLVPDSGMSYTLPRLVGPAKAFELLAFSPRLNAEEALRLGLVNRVVPAAHLIAEAEATARELAQGPRSLGWIKQLLQEPSPNLESALEREAEFQEQAGRTEDHQEGLRAFREKRPPRFQGR